MPTLVAKVRRHEGGAMRGETCAGLLHQKSNCALILSSRAAMIDAGFKYVGP